MKIIAVAVACLLSSCETVRYDPGPLADAAVTIATVRAVKSHPEAIPYLAAAADGLDSLALTGTINRETVDAILSGFLRNEPEVSALVRAAVQGLFPATSEATGPPNPKWAALAQRAARDIRAGLPIVVAK